MTRSDIIDQAVLDYQSDCAAAHLIDLGRYINRRLWDANLLGLDGTEMIAADATNREVMAVGWARRTTVQCEIEPYAKMTNGELTYY